MAFKILEKAKRLKYSKLYSRVFVAPDRTPEEQRERAKLVEKLKLKIKTEPSIRWGIRKGEIVKLGQWERESESD